jgi:hypothetical protein
LACNCRREKWGRYFRQYFQADKKEITTHAKPVALVNGANKGIGLRIAEALLADLRDGISNALSITALKQVPIEWLLIEREDTISAVLNELARRHSEERNNNPSVRRSN